MSGVGEFHRFFDFSLCEEEVKPSPSFLLRGFFELSLLRDDRQIFFSILRAQADHIP
jgi:hypothetical protein